MTTQDHKDLAKFLKDVHSNLRTASKNVGTEEAWRTHCENKHVLKEYAKCMEKLATTHWEDNFENEMNAASSRIKWTVDFCYEYFLKEGFIRHRTKEIDIAEKINIRIENHEHYFIPLRLLDVGSCYNPFKIYDFLKVTAIDLCPANDSVFECDFLNVQIGCENKVSNTAVNALQEQYFDIVTFCFLLEYIPSSELRIKACENAYKLLKPGGLLIINTPDSKHVGANSRLMKCWQYTLSFMGFTRIRYEKKRHMHCMAFRKALCKLTAVRWATLHEQHYMERALHISQDFQCPNEKLPSKEIKPDLQDFEELPFCDLDVNYEPFAADDISSALHSPPQY